jgi:hypothetical protein
MLGQLFGGQSMCLSDVHPRSKTAWMPFIFRDEIFWMVHTGWLAPKGEIVHSMAGKRERLLILTAAGKRALAQFLLNDAKSPKNKSVDK